MSTLFVFKSLHDVLDDSEELCVTQCGQFVCHSTDRSTLRKVEVFVSESGLVGGICQRTVGFLFG